MANVKDLLVNGSARVIGTIYGNATSATNSDKLDGKHLNEIAAAKSTTLAWNTSSTIATIGGNNITVTMPANPNTDTHYTTGITAGATGTTSNSATTNGNTFIKIKDNSTHRGQIKLVGSGATSVSSDANGVITISSTDNNTTYGSMSVSEGTTGTATTNRVLTAANLKGIINAHAPTKTGGGASGSWGISVTGSSASCTGNAASASKVNNKLTVGSKTFDGSAAVTIAASDLGLASAMLFLGTTTTAITDGAKTNPVAIGGSNKTITAGNVVLYGSKEFVWTGSAWEELGNEGSYKIVQAAVGDPSASGTSNTFIATISQDANGKITATKKTVAVTNSAPTLAWGTTSTIGTVAGTNLQVKMPANPNTDTKNTAGSTDTSSKIFLIGATSQAANPQTYSHDTAYVGTDGCLYSNSTKVSVEGHTHNYAGSSSAGGAATSANKLTTARTISLTGSVTGSGTFDGSGNLSIATTTNHTHNYAGSSSAGGAANSANKLATARTITLSGAVTGSASFDGSKNITITTSSSQQTLPYSSSTSQLFVTTTANQANYTLSNFVDNAVYHVYVNGFKIPSSEYTVSSSGVVTLANPPELANQEVEIVANYTSYVTTDSSINNSSYLNYYRQATAPSNTNALWLDTSTTTSSSSFTPKLYDGGKWNAIGGADTAVLDARYVKKSGDTVSGVIRSTYKSGTWVNSLTNSVISIDDHSGDYGGWICGPTKDGRITISTYEGNDNTLYFGYGEKGRTTNSFAQQMTWNGPANTLSASKVYGAVWNDYAEFRQSDITEPGRVVIENGNGTLSLSTKRLQRGAEVISDTYGFAIGETDECKTPIAATGRVLAYTYEPIEEYRSKTGWPVCSGPNGTVSIMTEEEEEKYPSRIIGIISEVPDYEEWGTGKVKTNGRVWIRIK